MAKSIRHAIPTHPGLAGAKGMERALMVHTDQAQDAFMPASIVAKGAETVTLLDMCYVGNYVAALHTETLDNSGTFAAADGGMVFTFGAAQNNDAFCISKRANTIAQDKVHTCIARVALADVDQDGFYFGFWTAADAEIAQAEPADGVWLESGPTVATLIGTVRANSGTSADSGTLATLADATSVEVGFQFAAGATTATTWGNWYVNGTATPFTAAQITALAAILATTPASLCAGIGGTPNDGGTDTVTVQFAYAGVDR